MERKEKLKNKVKNILIERSFYISEYKNFCFDILGKNNDEIFAIKILSNVDSIQQEHAIGLRAMAKMLDVFSCIVGEVTRYERLKDGIIYERFDVPTFTYRTLEFIIDGRMPILSRDRGGLFVTIDPRKLRKSREKLGLSREKLARMVGTTKKNIYEHEKREFRASYELVKKLEKVLGTKISRAFEKERSSDLEIKPRTRTEVKIVSLFREMGFETVPAYKSPADIIIRKRIVALGEVFRIHEGKVNDFIRFADFFEKPAFVISDQDLDLDLPILRMEDVKRIKDEKTLMKIIK